jgi:predicted transcriptional regulator of viral defense system
MAGLGAYLDDRLAQGRAVFSREEALAALNVSPAALSAALARQVRKRRVAVPKHGFYLILRPEDRALGTSGAVRWIDPLMKYLRLDYRIGLLSAAAFHGSAHQSPMVFQVIVPRQIRALEIGRQRLEFIFQSPAAFSQVNQEPWLHQLKSDAGYAKASGIELTLLDCTRYHHKVAGFDNLALIIRDLGEVADPGKLAALAEHYENACVRRLGYFLETMGHAQQADALRPFVQKAKSEVLLHPAVKPLASLFTGVNEKQPAWKLAVNVQVDLDW